jgi:hypothetical protein
MTRGWRRRRLIQIVEVARCVTYSPARQKVGKIFKRNDLRPDLPVQVCGLREEPRFCAGALSILI